MTNYEWLIGDKANRRIIPLAEIMQNKILADASREFKITFSDYSPLMTYCDRYPGWNADTLNASAQNPGLQTDSQALTLWQNALETNNGTLDLGLESDLPVLVDVFLKSPQNKAFTDRYRHSLDLLAQHSPSVLELHEKLVTHILPVYSTNEELERIGLSTHTLKGALFFMLSENENETVAMERVIDIAHEVGHQSLMVYLSCDRMIESSHSTLTYSGARKENRQAIRCLHAATALAYEIDTTVKLLGGIKIAKETFNELMNFLTYRIQDQFATLESLNNFCKYTEFGSIYMAELMDHTNSAQKMLDASRLEH